MLFPYPSENLQPYVHVQTGGVSTHHQIPGVSTYLSWSSWEKTTNKSVLLCSHGWLLSTHLENCLRYTFCWWLKYQSIQKHAYAIMPGKTCHRKLWTRTSEILKSKETFFIGKENPQNDYRTPQGFWKEC